MTKRVDNLIFDFDGTLCDSQEGIFKCLAYTMQRMGEPPLDEARMRRFIGPALYLSFQHETGFSPERAQEAVDYYRERYIPVGVFECKLYPGIMDMLTALKRAGVPLSVASAKPQQSVERAIGFLQIDRFFDRIIGAPPDVKQNEKDAYIRAARTGITPMMIGDSPFDIEAGKRQGIYTAAVTYGFYPADMLVPLHPDYRFDSVSDMHHKLLQLI